MKTLLVGDCSTSHVYQLLDPDGPNESQFSVAVEKALSCVYPAHRCIPFHGGFRLYDRVSKPDLALVARDFSHWFIIEVELVSHSFERHVLPQVKAFEYGAPEPDCIGCLSRGLDISPEQARTFLDYVPRSVAVIANKRIREWDIALGALGARGIQLLAVSVFQSLQGAPAIEVDGHLEILAENLGFAIYSATDRSLRLHRGARVPAGTIQIADPAGAVSSWTVTPTDDATWLTKDTGAPDFEHESYIQLIRTIDGRISFRRPRVHIGGPWT